MIATSDGASMTAARSSTRRADNSVGHASFLDLLAATSQQPPAAKPQTDTTASAKEDTGQAAKNNDRQSDPVQTALQPGIRGAAVRDGGKPDKKADIGKDKNAAGPADSRQAEAAQTPSVPAATQPISQSIASTPVTDDDSDGTKTSSVLASGHGSADPLMQTAASIGATGNAAGQPNGPQTIAPPGSPAVDDDADLAAGDGAVGTEALSASMSGSGGTDPMARTAGNTTATAAVQRNGSQTIAPSGSPAADDKADPAASATDANKISIARDLGDVSAGNAAQPGGPMQSSDAKNAADSSTGNQATEPPPPKDRNPDPVTQIAIAAPPAVKAPQSDAALQVTLTAGVDDGRTTGAPDGKSAVKDRRPADASDQTAFRTSNSSPTIAAPQISATAPNGSGKDKPADNNPVRVASTSDDKSGRPSPSDAPQPQIELTIPVTHAAAPSNTAPQGLMTIDPVGANPGAGPANVMVDTSVHIAPTNGDPAPNLDALAVSIAARSLSGAKQFDIRLDPPELGRVDVRLSIDASGKAEAHMTADQPQTLALLQKDAPTLTQALRDAGLDVSQSGLNFSLRGQDRQSSDGDGGAGQGRRINLAASRAIDAAQTPAALSFNGAAAEARVDIHV